MSRTRSILSLTTDFGTREAYIGAMKGVIYGICPYATLVDISHHIPKHSILQGAFVVAQASPYFPVDAVHLVVIDPGVGTSRRRIIVQSKRSTYVYPDNGVLSFIIEQEGLVRAVEITNKMYMLPNPSRTFEGRDVFAPVAAHLAKGVSIDKFGPKIDNLVMIVRKAPISTGREVSANIIHIDWYGNIITNISEELFERSIPSKYIEVTIGKIAKRLRYHCTHGDVPVKSPLVLFGSSGFLEIAVNQGNAENLFHAKVGDKVKLLFIE